MLSDDFLEAELQIEMGLDDEQWFERISEPRRALLLETWRYKRVMPGVEESDAIRARQPVGKE